VAVAYKGVLTSTLNSRERFIFHSTWYIFKTLSEMHGDGYPIGNLERYPWAWNWHPDSVWEDGDGNTRWQNGRQK